MTESLDSDTSGISDFDSNITTTEEDDDWNPWFLDGDRNEIVDYFELSDADMSSISEGYPRREMPYREIKTIYKEGEYWQIQKLIKFVKVGDQTTTAVALACLADFDYNTIANQSAFVESDGLEMLVNLLDVKDFRCQLGAIVVLSKLSVGEGIQKALLNLGTVSTLLKLLSTNMRDLQKYAALTLQNIAVQRTCRTIVRKKGGVAILVELADCEDFGVRVDQIAPDTVEKLELAKIAIQSLVQLARSRGIRSQLCTCGIVRLFPNLLKSSDRELVLSTFKIIVLCAALPEIVESMETSSQIKLLIKHLQQGVDAEKEELISKIFFRLAESKSSRDQMGKLNIIQYFCNMAKKSDYQSITKTLKYCVGTLWKASVDDNNLRILDESNLVSTMVHLLSNKNIWVRTSVAGCLAELTRFKHNQISVLKINGLEPLIAQANYEFNNKLLENLCRAIGHCALSPECSEEINRLGGLKTVWSHLNGTTPELQASAGWALVPILSNGEAMGEKVRGLEGGKELLLTKLKSKHTNIAAAACAALAEVMKDEENLEVLSELNIVEQLTKLTATEDDVLRESLAKAIGNCSMSRKNGVLFGKLGALNPLVEYLGSKNLDVVVAAAYALWKLSIEPINCITLHKRGVVPFLIECVGSEDYRLQEAAAGCLNNLRLLAFEADQRKHLGGRVLVDVKRPSHFKPQFENLLEATTIQELYNTGDKIGCGK